MNEFTLLTALKSIKRNFLVTVVLFFASYWVIPSLNIIENQYSMKKIINLGEFEPGHPADLLTYEEIHAILESPNTATFLSSSLGDSGVAQYSISRNKEKNINLVLKSQSSDNIVNTASLIMQRLKEFDEREIQTKIKEINSILDDQHKVLQIIESSDEKYILTNEDIEQYLSFQKFFYDSTNTEDVSKEYTNNIDALITIKRDETSRKVKLQRDIIAIKKNIENMELVIEEGFKGVSYLYPVSAKEISKFYPNSIVFFGISLLVAFFYNLIMLNIVYFKYTKSAK